MCFSSQDENQVKETSDQLEALTAHMDYVQENIADSQASIMEMEVSRYLRSMQYQNIFSNRKSNIRVWSAAMAGYS